MFKRVSIRGERKSKKVRQILTQIKRGVGQRFQERFATPKQFKTQRYDDAAITERIRKATT
jgi:hypothetical protein